MYFYREVNYFNNVIHNIVKIYNNNYIFIYINDFIFHVLYKDKRNYFFDFQFKNIF